MRRADRLRSESDLSLLIRLLCVGALALLAPGAISQSAADVDPRLQASRDIVRQFGTELQGALQGALQQSGAAGAITVCRDLAPEIASRLSRASGAKVSRISRRYRNPQNAPESWQAEALERFAGRGEEKEPPEHFAEVDGGARYLKAIRLAPLCTACHGKALAPGVIERLDADYPHDLARDYEVGELRGAFSVIWPTTPAAPAAAR